MYLPKLVTTTSKR